MSKTLLADSMKKLKETRPDAPAWIMDRAEAIADQRLEQASREALIKGAAAFYQERFFAAPPSG